jgi:hypothetical protein
LRGKALERILWRIRYGSLRNCRETDYGMHEWINKWKMRLTHTWFIYSFHHEAPQNAWRSDDGRNEG